MKRDHLRLGRLLRLAMWTIMIFGFRIAGYMMRRIRRRHTIRLRPGELLLQRETTTITGPTLFISGAAAGPIHARVGACVVFAFRGARESEAEIGGKLSENKNSNDRSTP